MHLSGQLSDWSISDLLHIMEVTSKTGSLDIEGERHGRVHFRDGRVTGAELDNENGPRQSEVADVLYVLSTLEDGSFSVGPADGPDVPGVAVKQVIAEVDALRSIEEEVVHAGLLDAPIIRLTPDIDQPLTVSPEDWATLAHLVNPFTFSTLEESQGRVAAVRIFHTLHRLGVAESIDDEDEEAYWLDKVADDLSEVERAGGTNGSGPSLVEEPDEEPMAPVIEIDETDVRKERVPARGVSAPASTTLTDGVYDEIRRLRSRVNEK
jgi:hypothetical protein